MNTTHTDKPKAASQIYFPTALGGVGSGGVYQVSARAEVKGLHQSLAQAKVAEELFDVDLEGNKACFYADDEHHNALYEAQQRCADLAAKASAQCLNGVDLDGSYESELDIVQVWGQWCAFSPDDSDSVGLSYGIAVFLSWWQQNLQRTLFEQGHWPVFATGHIQGAGTVTPVTGLEEKAGGILSFLASSDMGNRPFWFFYHTEEVSEAGSQFEALLQHPQCHGVQVSSLVECLLRLTGDDSSYFDSNWSPFKGLSSYGFYDQYSYAGRETVAGAFAKKLLGLGNTSETPPKRLAVVYAPSGRGKSSFMAAGVAPHIRSLTKSQTECFYFFRSTPSQAWRHQDNIPDDELTEGINRLLSRTGSEKTLPTINNTAGIFNDLAEQLSVLVSQQSEEPTPSTVFICFDQFEGLFDNAQVNREERADILHHINILATCTPHLHIAITLKQEYLGEIAEYFDDEQLIKQHLPAMEVSHWQKSIDRLMTYAGVRFEPRRDVYEKDLRDILVDEAAKAGKDNAPMLSFLLQQLYDKSASKSQITYQDYLSVTQATTETTESGYLRIVGGIEGVISQKADEILHNICQTGDNADTKEEKQEILLSKLLTKLVDIQDEKTGETGLLSIPLSLNDDSDKEFNNLAEQLAMARLLLKSTDSATGHARFRIAHEAFLKWPKVTRWAEKNREFKLWLQRTTIQERSWARTGEQLQDRNKDLLIPKGKPLEDAKSFTDQIVSNGQTEVTSFIEASIQKETSDKRRRALFGSALFIVLSFAVIVSLWQRNVAIENAMKAVKNEEIAQFEREVAENNEKEALRQKNIALDNQIAVTLREISLDISQMQHQSAIRKLLKLIDEHEGKRDIPFRARQLLSLAASKSYQLMSVNYHNPDSSFVRAVTAHSVRYSTLFDGEIIIVYDNDNHTSHTLEPIYKVSMNYRNTNSKFIPGTNKLVIFGDNIQIIDIDTEHRQKIYVSNSNYIKDANFENNGERLVVVEGNNAGELFLFNINTLQKGSELKINNERIATAVFSNSNSNIIYACGLYGFYEINISSSASRRIKKTRDCKNIQQNDAGYVAFTATQVERSMVLPNIHDQKISVNNPIKIKATHKWSVIYVYNEADKKIVSNINFKALNKDNVNLSQQSYRDSRPEHNRLNSYLFKKNRIISGDQNGHLFVSNIHTSQTEKLFSFPAAFQHQKLHGYVTGHRDLDHSKFIYSLTSPIQSNRCLYNYNRVVGVSRICDSHDFSGIMEVIIPSKNALFLYGPNSESSATGRMWVYNVNQYSLYTTNRIKSERVVATKSNKLLHFKRNFDNVDGVKLIGTNNGIILNKQLKNENISIDLVDDKLNIREIYRFDENVELLANNFPERYLIEKHHTNKAVIIFDDNFDHTYKFRIKIDEINDITGNPILNKQNNCLIALESQEKAKNNQLSLVFYRKVQEQFHYFGLMLIDNSIDEVVQYKDLQKSGNFLLVKYSVDKKSKVKVYHSDSGTCQLPKLVYELEDISISLSDIAIVKNNLIYLRSPHEIAIHTFDLKGSVEASSLHSDQEILGLSPNKGNGNILLRQSFSAGVMGVLDVRKKSICHIDKKYLRTKVNFKALYGEEAFVTISEDNTLQIWSFKDCSLLSEIQSLNLDSTDTVSIVDNKLISAGKLDQKIRYTLLQPAPLDLIQLKHFARERLPLIVNKTASEKDIQSKYVSFFDIYRTEMIYQNKKPFGLKVVEKKTRYNKYPHIDYGLLPGDVITDIQGLNISFYQLSYSDMRWIREIAKIIEIKVKRGAQTFTVVNNVSDQ